MKPHFNVRSYSLTVLLFLSSALRLFALPPTVQTEYDRLLNTDTSVAQTAVAASTILKAIDAFFTEHRKEMSQDEIRQLEKVKDAVVLYRTGVLLNEAKSKKSADGGGNSASSPVANGMMIAESDITVQRLMEIVDSNYYEREIDKDGDLFLEGQDGSAIYVSVSKEKRHIRISSVWELRRSANSLRMELVNRLNADLVMGQFYVKEGRDLLYAQHYVPIDGPLNTAAFLATLRIYRKCVMSASKSEYDSDDLIGTPKK